MKKVLLPLILAALTTSVSAQSWTPQATNFSANFGVDELSIANATTAWAFAYDGSGAGTYPKQITRTTNGGTTWTASTVAGPGSNALISDIHAIDGNTAWIITAPYAAGANANRIWKTTDGGATWTQQTSGFGASSFGNQIYFWDANNGWACGDPVAGKFEMYKTSNGGTTWTAVAGAATPLGEEYSYVGVKAVVGDNVWIGTDIGRILHSTDRGSTWTGYFTPATDFGGVTTEGSFAHMAFKDANNGLLIAVDGNTNAALYSTTDGGATWSDPMEPTGAWFYGDIAYVPGTENTYVTTGINSALTGSSYSTDGGLNWTVIDQIPGVDGGQRGKVSFYSPTVGWAGFFSDGPGGSTGILKFVGDLSLAVKDNAVKSELKVYPNPAVEVVSVTSNKNIISVTVFDLSGKIVKIYKDSKNINVSNLAKGNYILQAHYENGSVENTKLIKK